MATLYYVEHVHITQTQIPTHYFCIGQESEYESVPESITGNVNEPLTGDEKVPNGKTALRNPYSSSNSMKCISDTK